MSRTRKGRAHDASIEPTPIERLARRGLDARERVTRLARELSEVIGSMPEDERVDVLNAARRALHEVSPFRDEPVDLVEWVPCDHVRANDYNPNTVAPPEMRLLEHSITTDGYTQPIVVHADKDALIVVDGFHRNRVGRESTTVRERVRGHLPVTRIRASQAGDDARRASTVRHNRARGVHGVESMTDLVAYLAKKGWDDAKIGRELGMDADEVLRFRQVSGLAELFRDQEFSRAWEVDETALQDDDE